MSAADQLRALTGGIARRDATAAEVLDEPVADPALAAPNMVRSTVDLFFDESLELQRWIIDAVESTGRGKLQMNDVLCAAVLTMMRDPAAGRAARDLLAKMAPRPTRPKGRRTPRPQ